MIDENMKAERVITICRITEEECTKWEPCTECNIWKLREHFVTGLIEGTIGVKK